MNNINFKSLIPHIIALAVIIGINAIYFFPQFEGKVAQQGDLVQVRGMAKEIVDYNKKTGEPTLWTNSMFGGMPAYQISVANDGNKLSLIDSILRLGFDRPIGYFVFGMLCFYISMLLLGISPWLSLLGALFFGLTTNNMILFEAGHVSKIMVIMSSAPIIAGLILTFRKKLLLGGTLFTVALGLNILYNHIQMSYYLALALLILVMIYFVDAVRKGQLVDFAKSSAVLLLGAVLALGSSASRIWTTYEYSQDTMRGKPILEAKTSDANSSSHVAGLDYDYAMQWSNGWGDVMASYIPLAVGGGSVEMVGKDSPFSKKMGARKEVQAPTYFGSLPFTSGPIYFGSIVFFLFLFGAFAVRGRFKWWLVSAVVFTMILSMGKNFPILNQLMFDYFPLFNKFRTPNSILSVTAVFIPILAILGLAELINAEEKAKYLKPLYITFGILGGIALILAVAGSIFFTFETASDERYAKFIDVLIEQRKAMLSASAWRTFLLIAVSAGLIWAYIKGKLNSTVLISVIAILGIFDLYSIDKRYLNKSDFVSEKTYNQNFVARPVDNEILKDNDPYFRVYDATVNTFNSASTSYFLKTIGGYHAAKLQRYQDVIDNHIAKGHQNVLNMLNTKYFILPGSDEQPKMQLNPASLGNAWFVNQIEIVDNANAEIDSLTNLDAQNTAIVHKEFESYVSGLNLQKNGSINLTSYSPNKLVYKSVSTSDQFAVFSDIYYGPNKGWQAYIDGKPVDHIRVNYLLRGLKIPSGEHEIIFDFHPRSYFLGEKISLICSLLVLGLVIFSIYMLYIKKQTSLNN